MEKIPLIPLNVGNKLVNNFKGKARLFNEFFASKCTSITNDGSLPSLLNLNFSSNYLLLISLINIGILKINRSLNINKAHSHDHISIRTIKSCDKAILEPLSII